MTLYWPADNLAATAFSDAGLLHAMTAVETAWLDTLVDTAIAPPNARCALGELVDDHDLMEVTREASSGGNPVIPLVTMLRARLQDRGDLEAARWLHRGLTSQDVLDTAIVLMACDTCSTLVADLRTVISALAGLADGHRMTTMTGRTLTQPAVPIRFGAKVAGWLHGVLDAAEGIGRLRFPAQLAGAAGTLSGAVVLTRGDARAAITLTRAATSAMGLDFAPPWQTHRAPVSRIGEALTACCASFGRIANDVLTLARPEIGELREGTGGASSTMPQKANPVRSVLVRRAALTAPAHLLQLHLAYADTGDERPAGAWHVEWQPLQLLARHTLTAASQTVTLVGGLQIDTARMRANVAAADGIESEANTLGELVDTVPPWAGADDALIDDAVERARTWLAAS